MPECKDQDCICGHPKDAHENKIGLCIYNYCTCMDYVQCHAGQMFVSKLKQGFRFQIIGRGRAPESMDLNDVRIYIQMMLSHADQNIMHKLDEDNKPKGLIFDMITTVDEY